ncbi:MAG: RNA-directed DNA polymerase [Elusimicrobiaceae bacterium]|nr:RNA-directed DNA polymerase [Elusimicrobiaceae bacterium]
MLEITLEQIKQAYYFLKNHFYYDSIDLFTKNQLAQYEDQYARKSANAFFEQLRKDVLERLTLHNFQVSFRMLPKEIRPPAPTYNPAGSFFHNVSVKEHYPVKSVNFFIQTDIPTRILDILWILKEGSKVDKTLPRHVYASRLLYSVREHAAPHTARRTPLFKKYMSQYAAWRDGAFGKARKLLKRKQNCLIILLDIYRCFYSIHIPWSEFETEFGTSPYTHALQVLHQRYLDQIAPLLSPCPSGVLPVGLLSSGVLANWYLQRLDKALIQSAEPAFYGRYVDDILLVKPVEELNLSDLSLERCFHLCFPNFVFTQRQGPGRPVYAFAQDPSLQIQHKKLFIHYFNYQNSTAGLRALEEEVSLHNSLYRFLPAQLPLLRPNILFHELEYYHMQYHFHNLLHIKNAVSQLSLYLSGQIFLHQLVKKHRTRAETLRHIRQFFKGKNFLDFSRFWIKLFYLFVIINRPTELELLYQDIQQVIEAIRFPNTQAEQHLKQDLQELLLLSLLFPLTLNPMLCQRRSTLQKHIEQLRNSNLFEHRYVLFPLMNFLKPLPSGFLNPPAKRGKLEARKWLLSPRFIHLDEFILFHTRRHLQYHSSLSYETLLRRFEHINDIDYKDNLSILPQQVQLQDTICANSHMQNYLVKDFTQTIRVGFISLKHKTPLTAPASFHWNAQHMLHHLIGQAQREKVNLVFFPAGIVPSGFVPHLITYSRQTQMSFVFQVEHSYQKGNFYWVITLPFIHQRHKTVLPLIKSATQSLPPIEWHHLPIKIGPFPPESSAQPINGLYVEYSSLSKAHVSVKSSLKQGYHVQIISAESPQFLIEQLDNKKMLFCHQGTDKPILLTQTLTLYPSANK